MIRHILMVVFLLNCNLLVAQEGKIDIDFNGESLGQVLQMFSSDYGLECILDNNVDAEIPITTHLRNVTMDEALHIVLGFNGLVAVDKNGRYIIHKNIIPVTPIVIGVPMPFNRDIPPSPNRTVVSSTGSVVSGEEDDQEKSRFIVIWPNYLGADMAAMIFGGDVIENTGVFGGDSNNGSSNNQSNNW